MLAVIDFALALGPPDHTVDAARVALHGSKLHGRRTGVGDRPAKTSWKKARAWAASRALRSHITTAGVSCSPRKSGPPHWKGASVMHLLLVVIARESCAEIRIVDARPARKWRSPRR